MYEFFTASGNLLFSSAFTLLILIAVLEVLSTSLELRSLAY